MCTPSEAYFRLLDWIDKHRITFMILSGFFAGGLAVWYVGSLTERQNAQIIAIMEKQTIVQLETAKALQELSIRQAEANVRLSSVEAAMIRKAAN